MASLRLEPVGCRVWLSDPAFERGSGWVRDREREEGSVRGRSGQSSRRRGGWKPGGLELLGELPSGLDYSSDRLTVLLAGLL